MTLPRRLTLVKTSVKRGFIMKVAFASSDNHHIDQHFGWAEKFSLWEVRPNQADFIGFIEVQAEGDDGEDKIKARLAALQGCALVYVTQIGGPAAAKLVAHRIHPLKSKGEENIPEVVEKLQQVLNNNPPPWLRKALLKDEQTA